MRRKKSVSLKNKGPLGKRSLSQKKFRRRSLFGRGEEGRLKLPEGPGVTGEKSRERWEKTVGGMFSDRGPLARGELWHRPAIAGFC